MLNFEKLLEEIGEFGNYQKYAIFLLQALDLDKLSIGTVSSADASVDSGDGLQIVKKFVILMVSPSYQMGSVFYAIKVSFWVFPCVV